MKNNCLVIAYSVQFSASQEQFNIARPKNIYLVLIVKIIFQSQNCCILIYIRSIHFISDYAIIYHQFRYY